jgi:hypothetical protein
VARPPPPGIRLSLGVPPPIRGAPPPRKPPASVPACNAEELVSSLPTNSCLSAAAGSRSSLQSSDKRYRLQLGATGAAVLLDTAGPATLWASGTPSGAGAGAAQLCISSGGSLQLLLPTGQLVSESGAQGVGGAWRAAVVAGNLVVQDGSCRPLWAAPLGGWPASRCCGSCPRCSAAARLLLRRCNGVSLPAACLFATVTDPALPPSCSLPRRHAAQAQRAVRRPQLQGRPRCAGGLQGRALRRRLLPLGLAVPAPECAAVGLQARGRRAGQLPGGRQPRPGAWQGLRWHDAVRQGRHVPAGVLRGGGLLPAPERGRVGVQRADWVQRGQAGRLSADCLGGCCVVCTV